MTSVSQEGTVFGAADEASREDTIILPEPVFVNTELPEPEHVSQSDSAPRRRHIALWVTLAIFLTLVCAVIGWFFGAGWYYQDKAPLGVEFGGVSVSGQNAAQLKTTVKNAVDRSTITVKDDRGKTVKASLKDLGVAVNIDKTVKNLLAAKDENIFVKVNPFITRSVPLEATVRQLPVSEYLTKSFVDESNRAVPSTIGFDATSQSFAVTPGKGGRMPENTQVIKQINSVIEQPGHPTAVSVKYQDVTMPISVETAQQVADEANARVNAQYVISNGDGKNFQVPADQIAQWIVTDTNPSKGTISLSYDKQKIVDYMAANLPQQLNQDKVDQEDIIDSNGRVILTKIKGANGVSIGNTNAVADQIYTSLTHGQGATTRVESTVTKFDVKQTKSEMRIVIDKTNQVAYAYKNDQLVRTFNICSGANGGNESDNGNFFIYLKYATQDMTGLNDDGSRYLSKGVKWVSYYNGGEGFHTATWNYGGIASGDPANHGSHGCINMYEQDSKWVYDNCPQGTLVQVVGSQPTGPVR
ncbi:L,D-transpeptidase [Alloscardovia omnicolens]|uniref:L,D-transpeptidase n=1 Tax=Alloscardovia omnicolens TaxID=419015 RepID=UPI003A784A33